MPTKIAALAVLLLAAGCGSGGSGGALGGSTEMPHDVPHGMSDMSAMPGMSGTASPGASGAAPGASGSASAAPPGAAGTQRSAVPDACSLVTPAELGSLLGKELSAGTPRSTSPDRSVCMYPAGVITAVEVAGHYDASRILIDEQGRRTQDVLGLGTAAFYDPAGQVVAKGNSVFVAVTAFGVPQVRLKAAAAVLLDAAE